MDYEKLYKEALERAKNYQKENGSAVISAIFPELKKSEDEKIMDAIKYGLDYVFVYNTTIYGTTKEQCLAWLEKQGEQTFNILWHDVNEEPEEMREVFCEYETNDATWHDVAFYRANSKTFWEGERRIDGVVKWAYVDEMLKKQSEPQTKDFEELINKLAEQFPEVSFAKLSRIAVRVKNYLEVKNLFEQYNTSNAKSNSIWHTADEIPVESSDKQILVLFKDSDAMVVFAKDYGSLERQVKWAYINDLT